MKIRYTGLAVLVCSTLNISAAMLWGNSEVIVNERDAALASSRTNSAAGSFIQLIWAGADQTADAFVRSGSGVSGDDTVVATAFSAEDFFAAPMPGIFPMRVLALSASDSNAYYYVRVFNVPNPDYADGTDAPAPLKATYYWQSALHAYQHHELLDDHWDFAPGGGRTLVRGMIASNDVPVWWLVEHGLTHDYDAAALGNQDLDAYTTDREWVADTDPVNSNSFFHIERIHQENGMRVEFAGSTSRVYQLEYSESPVDGSWIPTTGTNTTPGAAGETTVLTDTNSPPVRMYRVNVSLP